LVIGEALAQPPKEALLRRRHRALAILFDLLDLGSLLQFVAALRTPFSSSQERLALSRIDSPPVPTMPAEGQRQPAGGYPLCQSVPVRSCQILGASVDAFGLPEIAQPESFSAQEIQHDSTLDLVRIAGWPTKHL